MQASATIGTDILESYNFSTKQREYGGQQDAYSTCPATFLGLSGLSIYFDKTVLWDPIQLIK